MWYTWKSETKRQNKSIPENFQIDFQWLLGQACEETQANHKPCMTQQKQSWDEAKMMLKSQGTTQNSNSTPAHTFTHTHMDSSAN